LSALGVGSVRALNYSLVLKCYFKGKINQLVDSEANYSRNEKLEGEAESRLSMGQNYEEFANAIAPAFSWLMVEGFI
jgi:hypothetical protein